MKTAKIYRYQKTQMAESEDDACETIRTDGYHISNHKERYGGASVSGLTLQWYCELDANLPSLTQKYSDVK